MLNCLSEGEEGGADHRFLTTVIASFGLETYGFFRRLRRGEDGGVGERGQLICDAWLQQPRRRSGVGFASVPFHCR